MSSAVTGQPIGLQAGDFICQHPSHGHEKTTWCDHLEVAIQSGQDSVLWEPLHTYHIPVFPNLGRYAIVRLMEPIAGNVKMCEMKMLYTPDVGRGYEVELGFWIEGDGCLAVRNVIVDYMRSQLESSDSLMLVGDYPIKTACPNSAHSFASQKKMESPQTLGARLVVYWDIIFEKACTFCIKESDASSGNNFGLGGL